MQPLAAIELLLLRDVGDAAELRLTPGRTLSARVVQAQTPGALGRLALAGAVVDARLPAHLQAGDELKLAVHQAAPDRLTLSVVTPPPAEPPQVPLPGGGRVAVTDRQAPGDGGERPRTVSLELRYEAPNLGAVDLHFQLTPAGLRLSVRGTEGEALQLMRAHLGELRSSLQSATTTSAVEISSRRDLVRYA